MFKNKFLNMVTLPTGILGFLDFPCTTVKPPHYRSIGLTSVIHSVVHNYSPDGTEPNTVPYQDMKQTNNFFMMKLIITNCI